MVWRYSVLLLFIAEMTFAQTFKDARGRVFHPALTSPRVVSGFVGADEILLELFKTEPNKILALSPLSKDRRYSAVAHEAQSWNTEFGSELEGLLSLKPELVLVARYTRVEWIRMLDKAGIKTFVLGNFRSIDDIKDNIRIIGTLTAKQKEASGLILRINKKINYLKKNCTRRKLSILNFSPSNTLFGRHTSFHSILDTLDLHNAATILNVDGWMHVSAENLLLTKPDYIIATTDQTIDQITQSLGWKHLEAVKKKRIIRVHSALLSSVSHHITSAMEQICKQL